MMTGLVIFAALGWLAAAYLFYAGNLTARHYRQAAARADYWEKRARELMH